MRTERGIIRAAALTLAAGAVALPVASAHAATVACGQVVTADVKLAADLNCSGSALTIGAGGVTVDLNGHTITGDGTGQGIGIQGANPNSILTKTTVRNGGISNFGTAIATGFAQDVRLSRLDLNQNGSGTGLSMDIGARDVRVDRSVVRNSGYAVSDHDGTGLTITRSQILGGTISLVNSLGSTTISRTHLAQAIVHTQQSNNILLDHDTLTRASVDSIFSFGLTVRDSQISGAAYGVDFATDRDVLITNNVFTQNWVGVRNAPPPGGLDTLRATISKNLFTGNGAAGVWLEGRNGGTAAGNYKVVRNTFHDNGHQAGGLTDAFGNAVNDGLHIDTNGPSGVEVTRDHTDHNADYGIEIQPGSAIDGGGNTSTGDPNGCLGVVCS